MSRNYGWGKQGHVPCKILLFQKASFVSVEFNGDHKTVTMMRYIWPSSV